MLTRLHSIWIRISLSLALGIALVLLLLGASSKSLLLFLLRPGALLADWVGYGAHDMGGIFLYVGGNIGFYAALSFALLSLAGSRLFTQRRRGTAS